MTTATSAQSGWSLGRAWDRVKQGVKQTASDAADTAQKTVKKVAHGVEEAGEAAWKTVEDGAKKLVGADPAPVPKARTGVGEAARKGAEAAERIVKSQLEAKAEAEKAKDPNRLNLPPRPSDARPGSEVWKSVENLPAEKREEALLKEIQKGNVPESMRHLKDVSIKAKGKDGKEHDVTFRALPDYVSVGSDKDNVRVPMTPRLAQAIADSTGTHLPTTKMVDDIHKHADTKVQPWGLNQDREKASTFAKHDRIIDGQLDKVPGDPGLIAGQKKDIVVSKKAQEHPDKVAIYGFHEKNGKPIQPHSTVHHKDYVDYSHGARLIGDSVKVDGKEMRLEDVLRDENLAPTLSNEGALPSTRLPQLKAGDRFGDTEVKRPASTVPSSSAPTSASAPEVTPVDGPDAASSTSPSAAPSASSSTLPFTPNEKAVEAARSSALGKLAVDGAKRNAAIYKEASEKTGVPAELIAAIHFNEGHMGRGVGPESGFGLDPRHVTTAAGNGILARHGMGPWERGTGTERSRLQSAIIAAEQLKRTAKAAGAHVGPNMSERDYAVAIHAYGTGSGSKMTKRAQETGRGYMFDPSLDSPHPYHPGGSSIGVNGEVVPVPPGYKKGLLRWDVVLPLVKGPLTPG